MKKLPLDNLFIKKVELHNAKYRHIYNIFYTKRSYFATYHSVIYLKDILKNEILVNQRILRKAKKLYKKRIKQKAYFLTLEEKTNEIIKILNAEFAIVNDVGLSRVLRKDFMVILRKKSKNSYLRNRCMKFKEIFEKELAMNKAMTEELYSLNLELKGLENYKKNRARLRETKELFYESQALLKTFTKAIGNKDKVLKTGKDLLKVLDKVQNTEVYDYIQKDIATIKKKVNYVMANPKESKLAYLFTGIYLIAPGTFEMTAAFLTLRYTTKYTVSKTKKLGKKSRGQAIRNKVHKRLKSKQ